MSPQCLGILALTLSVTHFSLDADTVAVSLAEIIEPVSLVASAIATAMTTNGTVSAAYPVRASTVQCLQHIHYACSITLLLAQCPYSTRNACMMFSW